MAKSMRSKIKKKWRATKRDRLEDFHRKKLEELNSKLREIAQAPNLKTDIKAEPIDVDDPLQSMRIEKPKTKKIVVTVEEDGGASSAPTPAPAVAPVVTMQTTSAPSAPTTTPTSTGRRGRSAMRQ